MIKAHRIYIDTNVIINYCTGVYDDVQTLNYVFKKRRKEVLFTSSLAIVQTISNLQTKKKTRKAFTRAETKLLVEKILSKVTVIDLTINDIKNGFSYDNEDLEDNAHYVLSQKRKCNAILTNNVKDFVSFSTIMKISPKSNIGVIKSIIN